MSSVTFASTYAPLSVPLEHDWGKVLQTVLVYFVTKSSTLWKCKSTITELRGHQICQGDIETVEVRNCPSIPSKRCGRCCQTNPPEKQAIATVVDGNMTLTSC